MRCHCSPADDRSRSIKAEITFDPETLLLCDTEIGAPALPLRGQGCGLEFVCLNSRAPAACGFSKARGRRAVPPFVPP